MEFSEVMQNLTIGIAGGIFSSIIVSVVFYVLNEYQKELDLAKNMTYQLYEVVALEMIKDIKINNKMNYKQRLKDTFIKTADNFDKFEPWKFKFEIKDVMCSVYNILTDGKYALSEWDDEIFSEVAKKIRANLDKLEQCERKFAKGFIKRIFTNRIIIIMGIMFGAMVVIA